MWPYFRGCNRLRKTWTLAHNKWLIKRNKAQTCNPGPNNETCSVPTNKSCLPCQQKRELASCCQNN